MPEGSPAPGELESAIRAVYHGPLEDFIGRRDALAKQLRADKRREDADRVKELRKPSRMAWALDQVAFDDAAALDGIVQAIAAAQEGRAGPNEMRTALRAVAEAGERAAAGSGSPVACADLVAALRAIVGDAGAFADLRAGRLVVIPEGGGLDLLVAAAGAPRLTVSAPKEKTARPEPENAVARAEERRLEGLVAKARDRSASAERAVIRVRAKLDVAEDRLRQAQHEVEELRTELQRLRADAGTAAQDVAAQERALAELRRRT